MKKLLVTLIALGSLNAFADCSKNESQGIAMIADQLVAEFGMAVEPEDFSVKIHHRSPSGEEILAISGLAVYRTRAIGVSGLLICNPETGIYEFGGAGITHN